MILLKCQEWLGGLQPVLSLDTDGAAIGAALAGFGLSPTVGFDVVDPATSSQRRPGGFG